MKVRIFIPCFIDQLFPHTAFNMVKLLRRAGCEVHYNTNQTCCGQPAFNSGFWEESKAVCKKFLQDFPGDEYVVTPSASCAGFIKNYYPKLFEQTGEYDAARQLSGRTYELADFLVNILKVDDFGASFPAKATYHDSCAALRECNISDEPRRLLSKVQGLELVEMEDTATCCGFGGTFAVKFEPISVAMADQKVNNAGATGAHYVISTDHSCLMHFGGYAKQKGHDIQTLHLADVLASGW